MSWSLKQTVQCAKCPWKISTDPRQIPGSNGYEAKKHQKLGKTTIAIPGAVYDHPKAMACHETKGGHESFCMGWLMHQLGRGNNISLRLRMTTCSNRNEIQLDGEQHPDFESTLP